MSRTVPPAVLDDVLDWVRLKRGRAYLVMLPDQRRRLGGLAWRSVLAALVERGDVSVRGRLILPLAPGPVQDRRSLQSATPAAKVERMLPPLPIKPPPHRRGRAPLPLLHQMYRHLYPEILGWVGKHPGLPLSHHIRHTGWSEAYRAAFAALRRTGALSLRGPGVSHNVGWHVEAQHADALLARFAAPPA